jgi:hypothetical protein
MHGVGERTSLATYYERRVAKYKNRILAFFAAAIAMFLLGYIDEGILNWVPAPVSIAAFPAAVICFLCGVAQIKNLMENKRLLNKFK